MFDTSVFEQNSVVGCIIRERDIIDYVTMDEWNRAVLLVYILKIRSIIAFEELFEKKIGVV